MVTTLIHLELVREYRMKRRSFDKIMERKHKATVLEKHNFKPMKKCKLSSIPTQVQMKQST